MSVEVEAKMRMDDPAAMAKLLEQRGASFQGTVLETNIFYDTDDRALLAADEGLRVRVSRDTTTGDIRTLVTHKGPNGYGPLKNREETEVGVDDADRIGRLLERLGYRRCLGFEKRRSSWRLDDCRIELDEVPYLGHFIEIEGPCEESVMRTRQRLGLSSLPLIKASYIAMLASHLQERGLPMEQVCFSGA